MKNTMNIKQLRTLSGMTQRQFSKYFGIPWRTLEDWETGKSECKTYIISLIEYKLENEGVIGKIDKK
ncbi:MAG: helix-turn-helix domain-containing protein [Ruminococcus sp.]|nr:helix-turn-helix domain-containing protein [Ruminococcus sp.]